MGDAQYWYNLEYKGLAKTADKTIGGFPLKISHNGVSKSSFEIDLNSKYPGQKIVLSTFREFVRVDFRHASAEVFGNTVGMLGDFKTGDLLARDGVTKMDDFGKLETNGRSSPQTTCCSMTPPSPNSQSAALCQKILKDSAADDWENPKSVLKRPKQHAPRL